MSKGNDSGITELSFDDSGPIRKVYEKYAAHLQTRLVNGTVMPQEILALTEIYKSVETYKKQKNPFDSPVS